MVKELNCNINFECLVVQCVKYVKLTVCFVTVLILSQMDMVWYMGMLESKALILKVLHVTIINLQSLFELELH